MAAQWRDFYWHPTPIPHSHYPEMALQPANGLVNSPHLAAFHLSLSLQILWLMPGPKQNLYPLKVKSENCSAMSNSLRPHGLYSPRNSPGQNTGMGSLSFLQGIFPTQRSNPSLPHCRFFPAEPQVKPKNTAVGSLSFLQWIFLTQESSQGLLNCRWILYQVTY